MPSHKLIATAILTALATSSCQDSNNSNETPALAGVASRYYLAPDLINRDNNINGVGVASGSSSYGETDLSSTQLTLARQYTSAGLTSSTLGGWLSNYSSSLNQGSIPYSDWAGLKSAEYANAETACQSGWSQISSTAYNGQLQAAQAVFNAGICELKVNGTIVARLPVQGSDGNSSYPIHILTRTDGSKITFYQQGSSWLTTTSEPYQLKDTGTGWNVTTPDGSIEAYNKTGKLVSITNSEGQVTELSYNEDGQLKRVTSYLGKTLNLRYTSGKLTSASSAAGIVNPSN